MNVFSLDDVLWFAENARRQRVGPMRVYSMAEAVYWYGGPEVVVPDECPWQRPPTVEDILRLGELVEPDAHNRRGGCFRNVPVVVGGRLCPDWQEVPRLVETLVSMGDSLPPDEWYRRFELIHPFRDGNGRTGAILWNGARWRAGLQPPGTLEHPPDFFDSSWFVEL